MADMKTYLSALTIYENNMRIIHWKLHGPDFHKTHERFGDYYDTLGKYMDETAEQMISMGMNPVNSTEACDVLQNDSMDAFTLSGEMDFDPMSAEKTAYRMFSQLYEMAAELANTESLPVDVQDVFMGHAKYFRIEGLYKLARRIADG